MQHRSGEKCIGCSVLRDGISGLRVHNVCLRSTFYHGVVDCVVRRAESYTSVCTATACVGGIHVLGVGNISGTYTHSKHCAIAALFMDLDYRRICCREINHIAVEIGALAKAADRHSG